MHVTATDWSPCFIERCLIKQIKDQNQKNVNYSLEDSSMLSFADDVLF